MMESKINKVWIVVVGMLSCWSFVFGSATTVPLTTIKEVTFDACSYDATKYSIFMSDLRGKLRSGKYGEIPVLRAKLQVDRDGRFILPILKGRNFTVTLALDVINAYVLGFKVDNKSYFFNDVPNDIYEIKRLFGDTTKARLPYGGDYKALHNAGASREKVPLGISQLNIAIFQLVKYSTTDCELDIACNLLQVIQMVTEAARFKYIERKLIDNFFTGFYPRGDVISLENNWGALSAAILTSTKGNFTEPLQLQDENYKTYTVSKVEHVQDKMGLLLAKTNVGSLINKLLSVF